MSQLRHHVCPRCAGFSILINLHVTGVGVDVIFTIAAISTVSMGVWRSGANIYAPDFSLNGLFGTRHQKVVSKTTVLSLKKIWIHPMCIRLQV